MEIFQGHGLIVYLVSIKSADGGGGGGGGGGDGGGGRGLPVEVGVDGEEQRRHSRS